MAGLETQAGAPTSSDLKDAVLSWIRWSWVIALATIAGAVIGLAGASLGSTDASSRATLGLSEDVEFRSIGLVVESHRGYASEQGLRGEIADATGLDPAGVQISTSSEGSVVFVTVTASEVERAGRWANAVADFISARGETDRLDALDERETAFATIVEEADANIDELTELLVGLESEPTDAAAETAIARARNDLAAENERRTGASEELARIERDRVAVSPPMRVVNRASERSVSTSGRTAGLLGAVLGLLAGLALTPTLARRLGRVRSIDHPELLGTAPFLDLTGGSNGDIHAGRSGLPFLATLNGGDGPVGLISAGFEGGAPTEMAEAADMVQGHLGRPCSVLGAVGDAGLGERAVETGSVAVLVRRGAFPRHRLARLVRDLDALSVRIDAIGITTDGALDWPRLSGAISLVDDAAVSPTGAESVARP